MNIKPSTAIRQNCNEIAAFTWREKMLKFREEFLCVEENRLRGAKDYTLEEVASMMETSVNEVCHAGV